MSSPTPRRSFSVQQGNSHFIWLFRLVFMSSLHDSRFKIRRVPAVDWKAVGSSLILAIFGWRAEKKNWLDGAFFSGNFGTRIQVRTHGPQLACRGSDTSCWGCGNSVS